MWRSENLTISEVCAQRSVLIVHSDVGLMLSIEASPSDIGRKVYFFIYFLFWFLTMTIDTNFPDYSI